MFTPALYQDHRRLRLLTFIGVNDLHCDGSVVSGRFNARLSEFSGEKDHLLVERFVNWPDNENAIVSFTRKYGPLHTAAKEKKEFAFALEEFREAQVYFRNLWREPQKLASLSLPDGTLRMCGGSVTYTASDLFKYLQCDLLTVNPDRVKVCKIEECGHPYFAAAHLKKQFCSSECQEIGHRAAKRDWWQRKGQEWLESRKEKEDADGTPKAR